MTQFSLFGAAVAPPDRTDLDGVLLALEAGWVRSDSGARLSVIVTDRWRADALVEEFHVRGVGCRSDDPSIVPAENGLAVRTGFSADLLPYAQLWTRGANQGPPPSFVLTSGGLRLWCIAAGRRDEVGYLLATAEPDGSTHTAANCSIGRFRRRRSLRCAPPRRPLRPGLAGEFREANAPPHGARRPCADACSEADWPGSA